MLGYSLFKNLSSRENLNVFGTLRSRAKYKDFFSHEELEKLAEFDALDHIDNLEQTLYETRPDYILNCIGCITQKNPNLRELIELNSVYPHKLAHLTEKMKCKIVHFSTDCVFSGMNGGYTEEDLPDAKDFYGKSKFLGEIFDDKNITIRTSIIGHELLTKTSLVDWFLNEEREIKGYKNAIFSGFPCIYISDVLLDFIFPNQDLRGIYHIASNPISKYSLLQKISTIYKKEISVIKDIEYRSDKSLNVWKFQKATNFSSPSWDDLLIMMYEDYKNFYIEI
jgi:dTDP-4-dehydrorhamnose reductase